MILGTAAYMSPEQAKGFAADPRSDVFAFGCVLFEMLTGRQLFQGESIHEILGSVLVARPDLSALPDNLNPRILELLRRCLEKNPKRRWQAGRRAHGIGKYCAPTVCTACCDRTGQ
jgi:serine/threonine protein kinase